MSDLPPDDALMLCVLNAECGDILKEEVLRHRFPATYGDSPIPALAIDPTLVSTPTSPTSSSTPQFYRRRRYEDDDRDTLPAPSPAGSEVERPKSETAASAQPSDEFELDGESWITFTKARKVLDISLQTLYARLHADSNRYRRRIHPKNGREKLLAKSDVMKDAGLYRSRK